MRMGIAALWLACIAGPALSQYGLEIIPLRSRTVEQVLPELRPLLEPGGTLSGHSNQLFVRASPANIAELKRALDIVDRPARRLQILVRFDDSQGFASRELGVGGVISNRGSRIEMRAGESAGRSDERIDQRLLVMEGGSGFIAAGQSTAQQDRATGFVVVPRLSGQTVTVDISQLRERGSAFQQVSTTASGRLGEWFELGGASSSQRVWLKVEESRN